MHNFLRLCLHCAAALLISASAISHAQPQTTLNGVSYGPYRADESPWKGSPQDSARIEADMQTLSTKIRSVRLYGISDGFAAERAALRLGLRLIPSAWTDGGPNDAAQIRRLAELLAAEPSIQDALVSSESILRGELSPEQLSDILRTARALAGRPVQLSVAEPWDVWLRHPELADDCDFIAIHIFPYWEGVEISKAADAAFRSYDAVARRFPGKRIVVAETGWPSAGAAHGKAIPGLQNQRSYIRAFAFLAERRDIDYHFMEAFDEPWKSQAEGPSGGHWGIFNADGSLK